MINLANKLIPEKGKLLYLTKFGSKLYGTDTENSDSDYKGIYLPSIEDVILGKIKPTLHYSSGNLHGKNTKDDIDITIYSLQYYLVLLAKGEIGALDILFSMYALTVAYYDKALDTIKLNTNKLTTKKSKAFTGYCLGQAAKYGIKGSRYGDLLTIKKFLKSQNYQFDDLSLPIATIVHRQDFPALQYVQLVNKDDKCYVSVLGKLHQDSISIGEFIERIIKEAQAYGHRSKAAVNGVDWKALSHAYRVIKQFNELVSTNFIKFPLTYAEEIKEIKYTKSKEQLPDILKDIEIQLNLAELNIASSELPDKINQEFINNYIIKQYKDKNGSI